VPGEYNSTPLGARIPNVRNARVQDAVRPTADPRHFTLQPADIFVGYCRSACGVCSPSTTRSRCVFRSRRFPTESCALPGSHSFGKRLEHAPRSPDPGTPTRSSSIRSGAMVAGAAPTHTGDNRTAPPAVSIGATITGSCSPRCRLLRHVRPSGSCLRARRQKARRCATPIVPPVIFSTPPARAPMR